MPLINNETENSKHAMCETVSGYICAQYDPWSISAHEELFPSTAKRVAHSPNRSTFLLIVVLAVRGGWEAGIHAAYSLDMQVRAARV